MDFRVHGEVELVIFMPVATPKKNAICFVLVVQMGQAPVSV